MNGSFVCGVVLMYISYTIYGLIQEPRETQQARQSNAMPRTSLRSPYQVMVDIESRLVISHSRRKSHHRMSEMPRARFMAREP